MLALKPPDSQPETEESTASCQEKGMSVSMEVRSTPGGLPEPKVWETSPTRRAMPSPLQETYFQELVLMRAVQSSAVKGLGGLGVVGLM